MLWHCSLIQAVENRSISAEYEAAKRHYYEESNA
jgi:hypothetical protein